MQDRFSEDLFLTNNTGKLLYERYAEDMPIIDFHCHLLPREIRANAVFTDLGEMWLAHDHYKWRAMRTFGVDEEYITGSAGYYEKFRKFAAILPELAGNPLYIWCALELKRYFGIDEPLSDANADDIYHRTKALIQERGMTPLWCMEQSNVKLVCTTDDPADSLEHHTAMKEEQKSGVTVLPAFRPDKSMYCEKPHFPSYIDTLAKAAEMPITSFSALVQALEKRLAFFKSFGTTVSDEGIEEFVWCAWTDNEIEAIFQKAKTGRPLSACEIAQYRSAFVASMGRAYHKLGFVMQLHIGTYQGANRKGERDIGMSTGFDCTDDSTTIKSVGALLNNLNEAGCLPKTILYPLDPAKIETFAVLAAGFCGHGTRGLVQLGAPWWFNDQAYGIQRQFEAVANLYPVSLSAGMITDSRSFISYPRHEVFRRVLCSYLGELVEKGEYFAGEPALKTIIGNMCYSNAVEFFNFGAFVK